MKPLVIVPFHDPTWLANVEANLCRQSVEARVVLVTNGAAAGLTSSRWQTTSSGPNHAEAVNAGVAWARDRCDFTHAVLFDSDDYYGAAYLALALKALRDADFCGKRTIYTRLADGLYRFDRPHFMGGTLGFAIELFVPMRNVLQDDHDWHARMLASGAREADTGPSQYVYRRHGANAHWQANDVMVRRAMGQGRYYPEAVDADVYGDPGQFVLRPLPTDDEVTEAM